MIARLFPCSSALVLLLLACSGEDNPATTPGPVAGQSGSAGQGGQAGSAGQGGGGDGGAGQAGASGAGAAGATEVPGEVESDYCLPFAKLLCGRAVACACGVPLPGGSLDEAACVQTQTAKCLKAYSSLTGAVAKGSAVVWKNRASACIAALAGSASGCDMLRPALEDAGCDPWFGGKEPLGSACTFPLCAEGKGFCDQGTCKPLLGPGEPCSGPVCAVGLTCLQGTCSPSGGDGAPCVEANGCGASFLCVQGFCRAPVAKGQPCSTTEACATGLVCSGGFCSDPPPICKEGECGQGALCAVPRSCVPLGSVGTACASFDDCAAGLYCNGETCVKAPGVGQPCAEGLYCEAGLACDVGDGTCQAIPGEGKPCALGLFGPFLCAEGLGCNEGTCGPLPGKGQPCTADSRCAEDPPGLACDFTPEGSFCNPRRGAGEPCQNDSICKDGLYCDLTSGTCAAERPAGAPCSLGNECGKGGSCLLSSGGSFACAPLPGVGQACFFDCVEGFRCRPEAAKATCLPGICTQL
jgi:hypothetical protein